MDKFCVDCKYLIPIDPKYPDQDLHISRCGHPNSANKSLNLVSGKHTTSYPFAEHERADGAEGHCGPEGKLWEAKGFTIDKTINVLRGEA